MRPSVLAFAAAGVLAVLPLAHATITFEPANGGSRVNSNIYYGVVHKGTNGTNLSGALVDLSNADYPYRVMDLFKTQGVDDSTVDDSYPWDEAFKFKVSSDVLKSAGNENILMIYVNGTRGSNDTDLVRIPIATVDGSECNETTCRDSKTITLKNSLGASVTKTRFFGVKFDSTESKVIGIYPKEICDYYTNSEGGGYENSCNPGSGGSAYPTLGASKQMNLTIKFISRAPGVIPTPTPTASAEPLADTTPKKVTLQFQVDKPEYTCPATADLNGMYTPGDSQVFMDLSKLVMTTEGSTSLVSAPATQVAVLAKDSAGSVDISQNFYLNNDVIKWFDYGSGKVAVTGFTNVDKNTGLPYYKTSFMIRDAAGLMAVPKGGGSCVIDNVRAAAIYGFLDRSKCFIATATYDSMDAVPVVLLRAFRDRVLTQVPGGKLFVDWYYRWSPLAAQWLIEHPEFRLPVLLVLTPLVALAGWLLHPLWALVFATLSGFAALRLRQGRRA